MSFRNLAATISAIVLFSAPASYGQAFSSGSTGSDGALNFTTPGTINFDPVALGLDPSGDNIFNLTTINIAAGVTVNMGAYQLREKPVVLLATGAVTIAGTLNLSGANGYPIANASGARQPAEPGPGGFPGGVGATITDPIQGGAGPGGGGGPCGLASYATGNRPYGNSLLVPLRGGSGGDGAAGSLDGGTGPGGGGGGGAVQIVSSVSITINGSILANGGFSGFGGASFGQCAGIGSGGAIHLEAPLVAGSGLAQALGEGQTFSPPQSAYGDGWIRIDSTTNSFTGTVVPAATLGPLFSVPLPAAVPAVTITSINGITVPSPPTASFTSPDITISSGTAVPVVIAATNIPIGTAVNLIVSSETGADQTVAASPLTGTVASSIATANIVWPLGVSRVFIRATW